MKKIVVFIAWAFSFGYTQAQDSSEIYNNAIAYMRQSDYNNAILILKSGLEKNPDNKEFKKQLSICYYFQNDNNNAIQLLQTLINNNEADDQCFQIAGNIYRDQKKYTECEQLFMLAISRFPENGALYNEMGNLLWQQKKKDAIDYWEKGIKADPNYSKNYYNACRYYEVHNNITWSVIYGEIFVNMEPLNSKTAEIKDIILDEYKRLMIELKWDSAKHKYDNEFLQLFISSLKEQSTLAAMGVNPTSLMMIRTRFTIDWFQKNAAKFPFKLFEYYRSLIQDGLFEAYNQWLFGSSDNLVLFQNWTQNHTLEYYNFIKLLQSNTFKLRKGEYYH